MNSFEEFLEQALDDVRSKGLYRELRRVEGPQGAQIQVGQNSFKNFSANDYLGLAAHPALLEAARETLEKCGAGSGSSRLISGSLAAHHELEEALAVFKRTASALVFSSGYNTAVGVIPALVGKTDLVVLDKLVHASIIDGAKLSGARLRIFDHNDLADLEKILGWCAEQRNPQSGGVQPKVLVVTESLFSMDGDKAPLPELVKLKKKYGAFLMVDEAHATGIFGKEGRGLVHELGLTGQVEVQMGTLGKALGCAGGFICGSKRLIELLINKARSFIFSTAATPGTSQMACAAIQVCASAEGDQLRERLWRNMDVLREVVREELPQQTPIVPILLGDEQRAVEAAASLREGGFFVPAIRFPTVARGQARLRVTLSAAHQEEDVRSLGEAINSLLP